MESLRGDDQVCVWCGEPLDPEHEGLVVIDEDERCYEEHPERYYDPAHRVLPRAYGHSVCMLTSVELARNAILQDVWTWMENEPSLDVTIRAIHEGFNEARKQYPDTSDYE
jgi:hypothetical protein